MQWLSASTMLIKQAFSTKKNHVNKSAKMTMLGQGMKVALSFMLKQWSLFKN